jgi:hypothetical protein
VHVTLAAGEIAAVVDQAVVAPDDAENTTS